MQYDPAFEATLNGCFDDFYDARQAMAKRMRHKREALQAIARKFVRLNRKT